jgi:hypothetical protein
MTKPRSGRAGFLVMSCYCFVFSSFLLSYAQIDLVGNPNTLIVTSALTTINHLTCTHDIGTYSLKLIRQLIMLIRPLEAAGPDKALLGSYVSTLCYTIGRHWMAPE